MKKKQTHAVACCSLALLLGFSISYLPAQNAEAVSLWSSSRSIFADHKAAEVGDTLRITISESTNITQQVNSQNRKDSSVSIPTAGVGIFDFLKAASISSADNFRARNNVSDASNFNASIMVTVVEVRPNGNMVVEGTQSFWRNNDEHKITLHGVVRRDDVTANNTVPSTLLADATVRFDGKGPLNAKQRQGILTQIFNILF